MNSMSTPRRHDKANSAPGPLCIVTARKDHLVATFIILLRLRNPRLLKADNIDTVHSHVHSYAENFDVRQTLHVPSANNQLLPRL